MNRNSAREEDADDPAGGPESVAQIVGDWFRRLGRQRQSESGDRDVLADALGAENESTADITPVERLMLLNVLRVGDTRVGNVMVPRADIIAVEIETGLAALIDVFRDGFHSRVPVYVETLDHLSGFVHVKDTLQFWRGEKEFRLRDHLRQLLFVPPSMRVVDLLLQMRMQRTHMAAVVDEYGGTDGLVTIEDLVEEIVGEIEDEHERAPGPMFTERPDGALLADGRAPVDELAVRLGVDLVSGDREEDIESVGGLIFSMVGRVPMRGEILTHPAGVEFEVLESDPRRVKRVRVRRSPAAALETGPTDP
ncbi:MAG: hemolysin family protein [Proteobacteria bacterium]|nr:hemolysin family protein [Pseudomonadota bacterium]